MGLIKFVWYFWVHRLTSVQTEVITSRISAYDFTILSHNLSHIYFSELICRLYITYKGKYLSYVVKYQVNGLVKKFTKQ
jgi:hypothetical protein